ncbi:MAG: helix-turn-helix domain-containing protein [Bifidobacterium scardovii]|uniref:helix-turn-helix domain-containing protein n=1 Tax=Bifidobacterium scardovii TaxID=158787 RepID=UPI002902CAFD|nr:helix-turn-helix domain-containing protein [Bifidobacterium scardovii]MDU2421914.1 helix-turn-helix domain-containing protein [Bifidobacterium scardovii]
MNYLSLNKLVVLNIRALLGSRRESIEALACATKIPLSTLKRRLLNKSPFTLEEIELIAKHFAVAASDLISPSIAIPALAAENTIPALAEGGAQ